MAEISGDCLEPIEERTFHVEINKKNFSIVVRLETNHSIKIEATESITKEKYSLIKTAEEITELTGNSKFELTGNSKFEKSTEEITKSTRNSKFEMDQYQFYNLITRALDIDYTDISNRLYIQEDTMTFKIRHCGFPLGLVIEFKLRLKKEYQNENQKMNNIVTHLANKVKTIETELRESKYEFDPKLIFIIGIFLTLFCYNADQYVSWSRNSIKMHGNLLSSISQDYSTKVRNIEQQLLRIEESNNSQTDNVRKRNSVVQEMVHLVDPASYHFVVFFNKKYEESFIVVHASVPVEVYHDKLHGFEHSCHYGNATDLRTRADGLPIFNPKITEYSRWFFSSYQISHYPIEFNCILENHKITGNQYLTIQIYWHGMPEYHKRGKFSTITVREIMN